MSDVKWIKITTDIFDDEKILLIESLPDAYAIIVVWFKLLCLAGKMNNSGVFLLNNQIAYTDKMLSTIFRMKESTVQLALQTFEQFGMVEIIDGVITIPNWGKHQNLEKLEAQKKYQREYRREYRKKQKQLAEKNECTDVRTYVQDDVHTDVRTHDVHTIEKEEDKDKDKEKEEDITFTNVNVCPTQVERSDVQSVVDAWNSLGLNPIRAVTSGSTRKQNLIGRINQFGVDAMLEAIENVRKSEFLRGQNKRGWTATFDWFIKPSNFQKVLEGNYSRKEQEHSRFGIQNYDKDDIEELL